MFGLSGSTIVKTFQSARSPSRTGLRLSTYFLKLSKLVDSSPFLVYTFVTSKLSNGLIVSKPNRYNFKKLSQTPHRLFSYSKMQELSPFIIRASISVPFGHSPSKHFSLKEHCSEYPDQQIFSLRASRLTLNLFSTLSLSSKGPNELSLIKGSIR